MFNTTTIPTRVETNNIFFGLFSVISLSILLAGSMMELFLYRLREKEQSYESDDEESKENYTDQYYEEFEALEMCNLTMSELLDLNTKIVREQVAENVEVILTFDKETETFWYYTDQLKEVSYDILETVARKFVIEYDCKQICCQATTEKPTQTPEAQEPVEKPSVFAKFKKYNTGGKGSAPNFTSVIKVVEQMNHFRYRGKLIDYEETQKQLNKKEEPIMDYASYKKTLCEKKEI